MVAPGAEARWGDLAIEAEATRRVYVDRREAVRTNLRDVTGRILAGDPTLRSKALDIDLDHDPPPSDALLHPRNRVDEPFGSRPPGECPPFITMAMPAI